MTTATVRRANVSPEGQAPTDKTVLRLEPCSIQGFPGVRPRFYDGSVGTCVPLDPSQAASGVAPNLLGWAEALAKFLGKLLDPVTWIRAAELIVGVVLILMGLKQFLNILGVGFPKIPGVPI